MKYIGNRFYVLAVLVKPIIINGINAVKIMNAFIIITFFLPNLSIRSPDVTILTHKILDTILNSCFLSRY